MDNNEEELKNWTGIQWTRRLMKDPALADKCDWEKLGGTDWALLLLDQPQFAAGEVVNHGLSRTGFANARLCFSRKRKRSASVLVSG